MSDGAGDLERMRETEWCLDENSRITHVHMYARTHALRHAHFVRKRNIILLKMRLCKLSINLNISHIACAL